MQKVEKPKKEVNKKDISSKPGEKKPAIKNNKQKYFPSNKPIKPSIKELAIAKKPNSPKKNNFLGIIALAFAGFLIVAAIGLILFIFIISSYYKGFSQNMSFSNDIKSISFDNEYNAIYIKIFDKNRTSNETSAKIKIHLKNYNGTEYFYLTNKTIIELLLSEVSIPSKNNILDIFGKKTIEDIYDFEIKLESFKGLNDFKEINYIGVIFERVNVTRTNTTTRINNTNTTTTLTRRTIVDEPPVATTPSTTTPPCNNSAWQNDTYRCNNNIREIKQERTLCVSGTVEERWVSAPCIEGYSCYERAGYPVDRCINLTLNCNDTDNGIYQNIFGIVNISNTYSSDVCIDSNKNLTEYSCFYNGSAFVAKNQTFVCNFGCSAGACLVCNDTDNDGYSPDGGLCTQVDCNDTDPDINPAKPEICGNEIDENCDGEASTCIDLKSGLVTYYKFNNSLNNRIIIDEKNNYNATCEQGNCPLFETTKGLNDSGAYDFKGTNFIIIPKNATNNNSYSISLWIKPANLSKLWSLIYNNAGSVDNVTLILYFDPNTNSIHMFNKYGLDGTTSYSILKANEWYHLVYTYNLQAKLAKLYLNGRLNMTDNDFTVNPDPNLLLIGSDITGDSYNGLIDEVRFYNRDLNQEEVVQLYQDNGVSLYSMNFMQRLFEYFKNIFG